MSQGEGRRAASTGSASAAASSGQPTTFYDSVVPALPAGNYQAILQQSVGEPGAAPWAQYSGVQPFTVVGPMVALPPGAVLASRPQNGSQGAYGTWLPHVLLGVRSLPWQVALAEPPPAGSPPWLALLLLARDEIDVGGSQPTGDETGEQKLTLADCLSPPSGTLGPQDAALQELPGSLACSVVDVTFDAFRAVAPQTDELGLLTHVRYVDPTDQPGLEMPYPGWYSVVIGNRFPIPNDVSIVHLVSLQGFAECLPGQPAPAGFQKVRLISLASWSFTSVDTGGDFMQLMQNLDVSEFKIPLEVTGTDPSSLELASAFSAGYTLVDYATRLGEPTVAWYRGPFQPAPVVANTQKPYTSASAALIYDPSTGIFDISYAAAWEIGRLLTLAMRPVALSLGAWVGAASNAIQQLWTRARAMTTPDAALAAAQVLDPEASQRATRKVIASQVAPALLGRNGTRQALGPPGDPAGLSGRDLPGLLDAGTLARLLDRSGDLHGDIRKRAIKAARRRASAGPARPAARRTERDD
jgi:hypothetical protein